MNENTTISRPLAKCVRREGVTVIEVMAAMLVALIGVFGVLVLIPFSVQQAQIGLDQETATLVGQNAVEEMQLRGYFRVQENGDLNLRGLRIDTTGDPVARDPASPRNRNVPGTVRPINPLNVYGVPANSAGVINARRPQPFHFDPIAVSNVGFPILTANQQNARNPDCFNSANNANQLRNPDFLTRYLPSSRDDLRLPVVTAVNGLTTDFNIGGATMTLPELVGIREADRIFRNFDDLVFGDQDNFPMPFDLQDVSDFDIPQPVFDVSRNGQVVRRQAGGRVSWSALFVPEKGATVKDSATSDPTATNRYRVYVLVYKDRSLLAGTPATATEDDTQSQMFAAKVERATIAEADTDPIDRNFGYDQAVDQIHVQFPALMDLADPNPTSLAGVSKDDWVMLINKKPVPDYGQPGLPLREIMVGGEVRKIEADEPGHDLQIGFARVTGVRDVVADMRNPDGRGVINVEGGAFNFFFDDIRSGQFGIPGPVGATDTDTYVIHLQNVVTVYERTITLEQNSSWN